MQVRHDVRLADLTTLAVGGPVERLVEVADAAELVAAVRDADEAGRPLLVLGGGSNVVAPDEGWPGDVVAVRSRGIERSGAVLTVQAGGAAGTAGGTAGNTKMPRVRRLPRRRTDRVAVVTCYAGRRRRPGRCAAGLAATP